MSTRRSFHVNLLSLVVAATVTLVGSSASIAAPLNLSKTPLFLNSSVEANFALTFDDSGSMELGFIPDEADDDSAPIRAFVPDYPDSNPATTAGDFIDTRCWWRDANWVYSSTGNPLYYNPNIEYLPPKKADGTSLPNATFTGAWEDGIDNFLGTETATRNLSSNYRINWGASFNDPQYISHNNTASTGCTGSATRNRVFPFGNKAFYYQFTGSNPNDGVQVYNNANYTAVDMTAQSATQQQNFANWYSYYRLRNFLARTALTRTFDTQQNLRVVWQNLNANQLTNDKVISSIKTGTTQRTNLFDFLMKTKHSGSTPNRAALQRMGNYFGGGNNTNNDSNTTNPYWEPFLPPATGGRELSCRQNYHLMITDGGWNSTAGLTGNYDNQSFTLPDGKIFTPNTAHTFVYSKQDSRTDDGLADGAFYYWSRDLRPNLTNNVPAAIEDLTLGVTGSESPLGASEDPRNKQEIYWNPANDPATWQHLTQYIVGFGIGGTIPFPSGLPGLRTGTYTWPWWDDDGTANTQKVDDTWHAALNGRGEFYSVRDPAELINALGEVFNSVERRQGKNTSVTFASGLVLPDTLSYQTTFDSSDWSGKVLASRYNDDVVVWSAGCKLTGGPCPEMAGAPSFPATAPNTRKIATYSNGAGRAFRWANLDSAQQTAMNKNPYSGSADGLGSQRLDYVRGDRSREKSNGGSFRNRTSLLGAHVNSFAAIPPTSFGYFTKTRSGPGMINQSFEPGSPERVFQETGAKYQPIPSDLVFVGSNDGMLHAFDRTANASGGTERFAYVPGKVIENLNKLTDERSLDFQSYVDLPPNIKDVFINGAWRKVLVGSLRLGGQGVYAIDITNPNPSGETDLASKVLWEFTDQSAGGADLGFTFGIPQILRMPNGDWAALVPGGYNSDAADSAVGSGNAALYVLRLRDGALLRKFDLGAGSKGLTTVIGGDYTVEGDTNALAGDYTEVTDLAFGGDLNGDLWRFDFQNSNPASWTFVKFFDAPTGQAITVQPRIMSTRHPQAKRRFVVLFGTGKYLEPSDRIPGSGGQQSFYGLFDQGKAGAYPITQAQLQQQTITVSGDLRTASSNQLGPTPKGWFVNLPATGERNITTAVVRDADKSVIFTTLVPKSDDPCQPSVESWIMLLDGQTGGIPGTYDAGIDTNDDGYNDSTDSSLLSAAFDTNNDGQITSADTVGAVGKKFGNAVPAVTPISLPGGGVAQIVLPGEDGNVEITIPDFQWRRRAWRELQIK